MGRVQYGILQDVFVTNLIMICSQAVWHVSVTMMLGRDTYGDGVSNLHNELTVWLIQLTSYFD